MVSASLIERIRQIAPLSNALENCIVSCLKEEHFAKRDILLQEGQVARRIYFIQKGFCRSFYLQNEKEYTTWFMGEGDIMISVYSFFTQKPSAEFIEVLEEGTFLSMSWTQLQKIYADFPEFNLFGRIITEQYYIKSEERAIALRTLSAAQRYSFLIKSNPEILQNASLGQIASHLGMNLETLSRIRAKNVF